MGPPEKFRNDTCLLVGGRRKAINIVVSPGILQQAPTVGWSPTSTVPGASEILSHLIRPQWRSTSLLRLREAPR